MRLESNVTEEERQEREIKRLTARAEQFRSSISGPSRLNRSCYWWLTSIPSENMKSLRN